MPDSSLEKTLGIFAKYWQPGTVKTRLAASVGDLPAGRLYQRFVETLVRRMSHVADRRILVYSPPERAEAFANLAGSNWQIAPQAQGDLGSRMKTFFTEAFSQGAQRVVLIGSDSPTLPVSYLDQAFELLQDNQVVLGPTLDGGYYLVGAAGGVPPIFSNIAWSSTSVWEQTISILQQTAVRVGRLSEWYDVDEIDDLQRLRSQLTKWSIEESSWKTLLEEANRCLAK